jgi:hypothetical protein
MPNIYRKIKLLPNSIQDLIYEYLIDYRKIIKKINNEFLSISYIPCRICGNKLSNEYFYSVDFFINLINKNHWCESCFDIETNDQKDKDNYIYIIKNYISTKTLQYDHNTQIMVI